MTVQVLLLYVGNSINFDIETANPQIYLKITNLGKVFQLFMKAAILRSR